MLPSSGLCATRWMLVSIRRRGVQLDVVLSNIFRILLALVQTFEVHRLGFVVQWNKIRAHSAGLECPFFPVDEQRPWIIRIGRRAPGAMLPNRIKAVIFER